MPGAGRAERPVTPIDTLTARLLNQAGVPVVPRIDGQDLLCPGSTLANGAPPPGPRGYYLRLDVAPGRQDPSDPTVRVISVTHACRYMYQGAFSRGGGFATTAFWEMQLRAGRWQVVRLLGRSIT
jgi:hypothetical protein